MPAAYGNCRIRNGQLKSVNEFAMKITENTIAHPEKVPRRSSSPSAPVTVSFIIPARNEERLLPATLARIASLVSGVTYEILVVDNGSTDATALLARNQGAMVLEEPARTVAGLRNAGAARASGSILVFLDADILITEAWAGEFNRVLSELECNNRVITGSRAGIGSKPRWIEKYWFLPMTRERAGTYMNSGHLILHRDLFRELGGFDERLMTGEDWDLAKRARKKGVQIINNQGLQVIHEGYPKTLKQFFLRERWHGTQDMMSAASFLGSRPAMAAVLYWSIGLVSIAASVYFWSSAYVLLGLAINSILCFTAAVDRQRRYALNLLFTSLLFHLYFLARGSSLLTRISGRIAR
jgi:glycosyltransferase involved in cell wall biosynthesis